MLLKFFGRGSGFADEHTSAYFTTENKELVIIDCPISTFQKVKHMDLNPYEEMFVLITHTHGDHIGGLGLLIQYCFFVLKKRLTIVTPSRAVYVDILKHLDIEGCEQSWFEIKTVKNVISKRWFKSCIPTEHVPQLEGKCFGYNLEIDGINVVYTGDTAIIDPYVKYLSSGTILYVDTSVDYGGVHLLLGDVLERFKEFVKSGVTIKLMHIDNAEKAEKIVEEIPGIEVVKVE